MTSSESGAPVLCVLTAEQQVAYTGELEMLRGAGVQLLYQPDPDLGLQDIASVAPGAIIVGMTVDMMEGLEFVAHVMQQYPAYDRSIVVLPDKGDPFPPVVHRRDPQTRRSMTEHIDLDEVPEVILAGLPQSERTDAVVSERVTVPDSSRDSAREILADFARDASTLELGREQVQALATRSRDEVTPPPPPMPTDRPRPPSLVGVGASRASAAPVAPVAPVAQPQAVAPPGPPAPVPVPQAPVSYVQPAPAAAGAAGLDPRMKWGLIAAAVAVVLVVIALLVGGGEETAAGAASGAADEAAPAVEEPVAAAEAEAEAEPVAAAEAEAEAEAEPEAEPVAEAEPEVEAEAEPPAEPPSVDLSERVTLPLAFAKGSGTPRTSGDADEILGAMRAALRANPSARIEVGGHTSEEGTDKVNHTLGKRRARAAGKWLARRGIPSKRLVYKNYAASEPASDEGSASARAQNRRVTVRLVE